MAVYRVAPKRGEEPSQWMVEKFAEIGWEETFVRHVTELVTILNATLIFDKQREDVNNAIMTVLTDGLMPAFAELEKIRAFDGKRLPLMDRREFYHDFCRKLWKAYKDLARRAAAEMGFDVRFLFMADKDFAKGLKEFHAQHPEVRPELAKFLEETRNQWQNELAKFRNTFLEHQDTESKHFAKFYELKFAESLFDAVWNTIVEVLAALLESRLPQGAKLALPDPNMQPEWPNRFVFDHPAFRKNG